MAREVRAKNPTDRRGFLAKSLAGASALMLAGCDRVGENARVLRILDTAEWLTLRAQRLILGRALAPEFSEAEISPVFKPNGSTDPQDAGYRAHAKSLFADWRLVVDGLVERPARFSLEDLKAMPPRTQITRHDCVEGWSCIGKWTGTPLAALLDRVGVKPGANYVVFHCADTSADLGADASLSGPTPYYESIDLVDAVHPQTILAYALNGDPLPVANGAPLRLRVERQLGYKMAKYIMRIELADSFAALGGGKGGYWEDRGYDWYAGI
jgi:DMSO/TMAO reductase YedYZ molybdopterin-dependent catalytic subunit